MNLNDIARSAAARLQDEPAARRWVACAEIWARLWVLAGPVWARQPEMRERIFSALTVALAHAVQAPLPYSVELTLRALDTLEVEDDDDGSEAWQHAIDLASVLTYALSSNDVQDCLELTFRTFLEGLENSVVNEAASRTARGVLSEVEAKALLPSSDRWNAGVAFLRSL